jgi:hypothetical protein
VPFTRRNNVNPMNLNSTRAIAAHRSNLDHLVSVGQDLARTAGKTQEMALASVQTIGYRTAMMLQALGDPVAMANPEFTLMGHEKVEAAVESHRAMLESGQALIEGWTAWALGQANSTTKAFAELVTCHTHPGAIRQRAAALSAIHLDQRRHRRRQIDAGRDPHHRFGIDPGPQGRGGQRQAAGGAERLSQIAEWNG